ncbi:transposase [Streptomyces sp. NPDC058642]|uniref:transposase n=1 Tax=Streptomyces sp. NPDC058642 TaxID=3346572 RepID=UPI003660110C
MSAIGCGRPTAHGDACRSRSWPQPTPLVNRLGHRGGLHHRAGPSACGRRSHRSTVSPCVKRGRRRRTPDRSPTAEPARPPGGGGAGGEGLGRSHRGFTSKLHLSAEGRCRPLSLVVASGQRADCTQFERVLEELRVPRIGSGRPRTKPNSLAAGKAYSKGPCRQYLRRRGVRHTIPEKTDSQAARLRKGSRGGAR